MFPGVCVRMPVRSDVQVRDGYTTFVDGDPNPHLCVHRFRDNPPSYSGTGRVNQSLNVTGHTPYPVPTSRVLCTKEPWDPTHEVLPSVPTSSRSHPKRFRTLGPVPGENGSWFRL